MLVSADAGDVSDTAPGGGGCDVVDVVVGGAPGVTAAGVPE